MVEKRRKRTLYLTRLVFLIAITLTITLIGLPQPVTGPLINTMLLLTTLILGPWAGAAVGTITPVAAAFRGQLPPFLLPMVPFIILGNALLVWGFKFIAGRNRTPHVLRSVRHWVGLVVGSTLKFLWLYSAARLLVPLFFGKDLPEAFIAMMAMPQLVTALIGGVLAFLLYELLKSRNTI